MTNEIKEDQAQFEVCEKCQEHPAESMHTCPYASDIHDDRETLCNCCEECTYQCRMDI